MAAGRASAAASDIFRAAEGSRFRPFPADRLAVRRRAFLRGVVVVVQKNWQELIKPNKLDVAQGDDPKRVATVVAEPLERGFGTTLGNALRRVLLSSLQGAAVTLGHIHGVLHHFSALPGVRDDVPALL